MGALLCFFNHFDNAREVAIESTFEALAQFAPVRSGLVFTHGANRGPEPILVRDDRVAIDGIDGFEDFRE